MAAPPSFAVVIPSRPVMVQPHIISQNESAFYFSVNPPFSNIVVFLLPGTQIPPGVLAGIYIKMSASAPDFRLLGAIGMDKQSAIFGLHSLDVEAKLDTITLGISLEPAVNLSRAIDSTMSNPESLGSPRCLKDQSFPFSSSASTKLLAQRIIENAFNFLASFAGQAGPSGEEAVVPLKKFQEWWAKFERRVENDPDFLAHVTP